MRRVRVGSILLVAAALCSPVSADDPLPEATTTLPTRDLFLMRAANQALWNDNFVLSLALTAAQERIQELEGHRDTHCGAMKHT